tara:strand:- start:47619 stop:48449 length:831 start_codon:yes stop_codon:yes gene_type:complete
MSNKIFSRAIMAFFLVALSITQISCDKEKEVVSFILNITHSDYDIVESLYVTATIEINGSELDIDFDQVSNIQVGETRSIPITYESESSSVDVQVSTSGMGNPTVQVNNVQDGDTISWTIGDSVAQVGGPEDPSGDGGDGDGDGDGNGDGTGGGGANDCKAWTVYNTSCLSGVPDGTGSSEAGVRARVCRLSETNTTITVRSEVEAINGGIDNINFYRGLTIYYADQTQIYISKEDFNAQGEVTYEFTVNKSSVHPTSGWEDLNNLHYATVICENN